MRPHLIAIEQLGAAAPAGELGLKRGGDRGLARARQTREPDDESFAHVLLQWRPHSLTSPYSHHQRPARASSPGRVAREQGAQLMDVNAESSSAGQGTLGSWTDAQTC